MNVGTIVCIAIVIGLVFGAVIGHEISPNVTTTAVTKTTALFRSPMQSACAYLESNYNPSMGLIAETPANQRYFLYSDNFLASLVLATDCDDSGQAATISYTISNYDISKLPNQYMAFDCVWNFNASTDVNIGGSVWSTVNNKSGVLSPDDYADVAFLQAHYYSSCDHNSTSALSLFGIAARTYDGIGLNDSAFWNPGSASSPNHSYNIYQTYKLALFIIDAELLNQQIPISAVRNMISMQNPITGGFYTGYNPDLTTNGTTNTETTCLAIMALDAISD